MKRNENINKETEQRGGGKETEHLMVEVFQQHKRLNK